MPDDVAIKVDHVSKTFKLPHEKQTSIKGALINRFKGGNRSYERQEVLKHISFEIKKGEFFGIVGRNGSGKSTLLKMLAGIYIPTSGRIHVNGKLTPFIELGVGFNPELTGRENVFLNGALLGFNRKEMMAMYDDIVEFAELEKFMDQKLKNYSSGMQVRLAFSIAIRANTDILVLDEVLAVGDAAFQQKCSDYFVRLKDEKRTIVLVTHDMSAVERYCDRAVLIQEGQVKVLGSPKEVANQYILDNYDKSSLLSKTRQQLSKPVEILDVEVISGIRLTSKDNFEFDIQYQLREDVPVYLGINVASNGVSIFQHNSQSIKLKHHKDKKYAVRYTLPLKHLHDSALVLDVAIFNEDTQQLLGFKTNAAEFFIKGEEKYKNGPLNSEGVWSIA